MGGLIAIVASSAAIVLFAEIIPQAIFGRHRLFTGAKTRYLTWVFLVAMSPITFPIAKVLDWLLGDHEGIEYSRDELRELLKETASRSGLQHEEINILRGALELTRTKVRDVMVPLQHTFMVEANVMLDGNEIQRIIKSGFSRIPVFESTTNDVVGMLFLRDLIVVALDWTPDTPPVSTRSVMRTFTVVVFFTDTTLAEAFSEFKIGRSHLALVRKPPTVSSPSSLVGIVTINDVLEYIVQSKILGEEHVHEASNIATTSFLERSPLIL